MKRCFSIRNKMVGLGLATVVIVVFAGVVWVKRTPLLTWYYLRGLAKADDTNRDDWVRRVVTLEREALPGLVQLLRQTDPRACSNAQVCLTHLVERAESDDLSQILADELAEVFPELSTPGQQVALELYAVLIAVWEPNDISPQLISVGARLMNGAARTTDKEVRARALKLSRNLLEQTKDADLVSACRELTQSGLRDQAAENRLQAIQLAMRPELDLLEAVVPLLSDPQPEVRRSALLAVGPSPDAISTDDLLPWLHDPDDDVRRLCEKALRGRGLQEDHLRLGRLMTDSRPGTRLQVLHRLRYANDLEPGVWLRRLSHDPAPAVRAAAARAASEQPQVNLRDRLEQMAQNDPCPTVRQLAQYYLSSQKPGYAEPSEH
jgi:hypothetical protein